MIEQLDNYLFLLLNGVHAPFFDNFMSIFTGKWVWVPMYAAILIAMLRAYPWRAVVSMALAIALTIALADQTCATLLRPEFERLRPSHPDNPISAMAHLVNGYRGGQYGFPSCHAANSFALAMFTTLLFVKRRWGIFIFLWAVLNSYSRLYLGVHYPGDLLVGALVGVTAGAVGYLAGALLVSLWGAPQGIRQVPPLRCHRILGREVYLRAFDLPIAAGIATIAVILVIAAFN